MLINAVVLDDDEVLVPGDIVGVTSDTGEVDLDIMSGDNGQEHRVLQVNNDDGPVANIIVVPVADMQDVLENGERWWYFKIVEIVDYETGV